MAKEIKYGAEARAALEAGVNQLATQLKSRWDLRAETLFLTSSSALR